MKFKATEEQVRLICINMINASGDIAVAAQAYQGANEKNTRVDYKEILEYSMLKPADLGYNFDYFKGRMVKTCIKRVNPWTPGIEEWEIDVKTPNPEYQSWARVYPTVQELLSSINIIAYE